MMSRRKFSRELKLEAVRRLASGQTVAEVARAVEVHPSEQTLEIDFLKRALQHVEEQRWLRALDGGAASTSKSKRKSNAARS
jgi:transposase-like protein